MRVLLRARAVSAARPHRLLVAILSALLVMAGCASLGPQLPMSGADETPSEELSLGVRTLGTEGEFEFPSSREVVRRLESRLGGRPLRVLALPSGGANGAFGAGALAGSSRGGTRPEFTVVTGGVWAHWSPLSLFSVSWFRSHGKLRTETHVDGGVTLPFSITPAPRDLAQSTLPDAQPILVRVLIDGPLRNLPSPTHDNAFSVFRRSLSAGLSHETRTQLESTVEALQGRGIALDYAAIPASFPLNGSFDFSPEAQRSLFEYAENCAAAGRLWIGTHPQSGVATSALLPGTANPRCPADDTFFAHLAALRD